MDAALVTQLRKVCPLTGSDGNNTVPLDINSRDLFDNRYFQNLLTGRGILQSDQILYSSDEAISTTRSIVQSYSTNPMLFFGDFVNSMIKMGNIGILTGSDGQIRKNCRLVNSN